MDWKQIDWSALERMRAGFLERTAGRQDYWHSESDLASYDATFAQRIGWKWDFVLGELQRRGWKPPEGALLDWGCGTGIASRAFLDCFGADAVTRLSVWDRSESAMRFAARRARDKYPGLEVTTGLPDSPGTVLISHVLSELKPDEVEALADSVAARATTILWVEPGTYEESLTLIAVRERLRDRFGIVAPCPHQRRCGVLAEGNEQHWCHHFASPPPEVFTDTNWGKFAHLAGIDLRSLPLSFLVLDRRDGPALPAGATRVVGRPRLYKGFALALGCADTGALSECRISKRSLPEEFRRIRKGESASLQVWKTEGQEVTECQPLFPETETQGEEGDSSPS